MKKQNCLLLMVGLVAFCCSALAQPTYVYTPTNVVGLGLTNVVPDMLLWYHTAGYYTNGPVSNAGDQVPNLGNWEPSISVMGDSTFLIGATTFADDGSAGPSGNQRFVVTFQPVAGGNPKIGDEFYADNGTPFRGQINLSRQNGNPQRVAGDKRSGATNFLTAAETSAGQLTEFQSASRTADPFRWDRNPIYGGGDPTARYVTVQAFGLNTTNLAQTSLTKAFDAVYGGFVTNTAPASAQQVSRTGGTVACLDNGNFVVVIDDKTSYLDPSGEVASAAIITPTGTVVKGPWLVDPRDIWDNVCAYSGGFAVRCHDMLYFYDNAGSPTSSTNINTSSGLSFGTGREDGSRIASDIRSHYVYLAGETPETGGHNPVNVAIWDARTGQCVATNEVTDTDPAVHKMSRVNVAVDAADHFCVAYGMNPDPNVWTQEQIVARVGKLSGTNVSWLTPSFFPFVNHDEDPSSVQGFITSNPTVAMTAEYICIAAKGTVNGTNNPAAGPSTAAETTLYTVITAPFVPGSIESVGLKRIVPDTPVIVPAADALGNWEPYSSVLGSSTFLIEGNTFSDPMTDPPSQRYVVALQPVDGKPGTMVEGFYADNGQPFKGPIDASRQNGNPGRVAGDKRPGAVNYMVGAEASPHTFSPEFTSDNRWNLGFDRLVDGRYGTVETYRLDLATLTPTPLMKAVDSANGRETTGTPAGNQITRFGGELACLDNGNFVSVVEDRGHTRSDVDCVTATIFAPDGSVVKESWVVANSDIWSNVGAYQGGFAIRCKPQDGSNTRVIYFFDNAGNLKGQVDQVTTGRSWDTGRGDGTRIASHINSPYVFLTGTTGGHQVSLAVFDSRDYSFVTVADVSEPAFAGSFDRAGLAMDALNRVTVAWDSTPEGYTTEQVAARVFAFDSVKKTLTPLTKSFLPFINAAPTGGISTREMNPSMTTRQIMIAAKGEINLQNHPEQGATLNADTGLPLKEINFYTVITHPAPADDPTTPVGGQAPTLSVSLSGNNLTIAWAPATPGFTLESKSSLSDPTWTTVGTDNPTTVTIGSGSKFYRLRK